jgi:hypothetical protein
MPPARATPVNSTAAALLGLLHTGPMTGGQLVAAAGEQFGTFFSVTRSQIYRELPVLAEAASSAPASRGRAAPSSTSSPRPASARSRPGVAGGSGGDTLRSPLVLRLLHAGSLTPKQRADLLGGSRAEYASRLEAARAAARSELDPYRRAVADFTVAHARAMLELVDAIPAD